MKLGVALPYGEGVMSPEDVAEFVHAADGLGYDSVWVAEAWSFDAFMILTTLIPYGTRIGLATGIVNVYSRTPALIGQSIATLDALSGGRAVLGIGTSGPQVIEGWHGVPFDKPVQRTRETIDIIRAILRRDRLEYHGEVFDLTKGLKLINHPLRADVPIVVACTGPKNVEMTAEMADGWMPVLYSPSRAKDEYSESLDAGFAKRDPALKPLEIMPSVSAAVTDDPESARNIARHGLALYIGGMGSREKNFYNQLVRRYGYEQEAADIQDLYLAKKKDEAAARISDELVDELTLIGPRGHVAERVAEFAAAGVSTLVLQLLAFDQPSRLKPRLG